MKQIYQNNRSLGAATIFRPLIICLLFVFGFFTASAQCPPNIDFENGDFTGWECWTGTHYELIPNFKDTINLGTIPVPPVNGRHTIINTAASAGILDPYGQFPITSPNGSAYSVKLGNSQVGGGLNKAEGVSYTFTIPVGQDKFNLTYYYAVILDLPTSHNVLSQMPEFVISLQDLTDGTTLPCPLDPFTPSGLPGFFNSPANPEVKCKNWAAASIKLDGYAGKTIRVFFKTANCTLGGHFGYAYIDIASECSSSFTGATFCPDDASVTITGPPGYATYNWYNGLMTQLLGTGQSLTLTPPPLSGDSVRLEVIPYNGYGCTDTLTAHLWDTLTVHSDAGPDMRTCDNNPVQLGAPPEPNRIYKWTPVTGLSDPTISNPIATPSVTTQYILTVTTAGGGCATNDTVNVKVDILSDSIQLIGVSSYCIGSGLSSALKVLPHDSIQWFKDNVPIPGPAGNQQLLTVTQTGAYYAMVFSYSGCSRTTAVKQIDIWAQPVAGFTNNALTQCDKGNQFVFTNTSTLATGTLQYAWDLGDGATATTPDVTHSYAQPGHYTVTLVVTAPGSCTDTRTVDVVVNPSPVSAFMVDEPVQCFKDNWFVFTNQSTISSGILTYTWDFGDGTFDHSNDIAHKYLQPGTYYVKLTAKETNGGCSNDSTFKVVAQQSPVTSFTIDNTTQCFGGNKFVLTNGTSILSDTLLYTWYMGDGVIKTAKDFTYSYTQPGNYTIKLVASTLAGCSDSTSHDVIVHPTPFADFTIRPVCENIQVPIINRTFNNTTSTLNYLWDFGNGHLDFMKAPVYSYPAAGIYQISLTVSSAECPLALDTKTLSVTIDAVTPGIVYPDKDAAFNYPEQLQARPIGSSVTWVPPTSLNNRYSYSPLFTGLSPQLYTIQLKTATGCLTVDTQLVKTHKKIEIYVPNTFTPDGNGMNDRLRPVLIGFVKVNYFRVFNRWGQLLFSMNSDQPGWDGKVNNKPADVQTVVWMIEAVDVDGVVHSKQGTTVLFR